MPLMSYLVSTYDSAQFLNSHLHNLLEDQTIKDIEVIVYNAASPGADLQIAQEWASRDPRVVIIDSPKRTPYGTAWFEMWKIAKSPIVCNSNTDDLHHANFTERFLFYWNSILEQDKRFTWFPEPIIRFVYAGWQVLNTQRQIISAGLKPKFDREIFQTECHAGPQVSWLNTKEFRDRVDWKLIGKRAKQHTSAFDYWLWLYFMSLGYYGFAIPEILTIYMQRPESIENRKPRQNTYESLASISEFFPRHFMTGGKLECYKEFADFNNLPNKEQWINDLD